MLIVSDQVFIDLYHFSLIVAEHRHFLLWSILIPYISCQIILNSFISFSYDATPK